MSHQMRAAALAAELPGQDRQVMRLVVNQVAAARGLPEPWRIELPEDAAARAVKRIKELGDLTGWRAAELGALREQLLTAADRKKAGAWYTPPEVARFVTLMAFSSTRDLYLSDDPADAITPAVIDPACGAGVFLVQAARELARRYAALLTGEQTPPAHIRQIVLPFIMGECVYGVDIDPVAVDLAKSACWLEAGGLPPIGWLDDNIIVGDALAGDLPPRLAERLAGDGPLLVVGNPPYKEHAKGAAPWIEARRPKRAMDRRPDELWRPSLDEFRPGAGRLAHNLSSLYVYFLRWALWRAFETRLAPGAVAFITPSAYLRSPAYAGMREQLRRAADQGWIVNLTPEGHQPKVSTRVFPGVQQPLCIGVFTRRAGPDPDRPARIRYTDVTGSREAKFRQLHRLLTPAGRSQ